MRKVLLLLLSFYAVFGLIFTLTAKSYAASDNANIVVQTIPGPTVAQKFTDRAESSWSWYLTRASGIVAAISFAILMLSGIGQVTGYTFRFLDPLTSWASHRALGIAFGVSVLVHMFSLLFDKFVKFNILEILIPWLSKYQPVTIFGFHLGSLFVALGVLSFYMVAITIITSLIWVEKKPHTWKWLHLLSYITMFFIFIHALYIGTDLAHGIFRILWIITGVSIFIAAMQRLWRAYTA